MTRLLPRFVLIVFAFLVGVMMLNSSIVSDAGAAQKSRKKTARRAPRRPALPSGTSNGVTITVQAIETAGQSYGDTNASLEANEGEEILVLHVKFFRSRNARDKSEVTFSRPGLLLKEGQEGQTNLSVVTFYQEPAEPLDQEMAIPFVVPEGAEPVALTIGDAALDLTKMEVTEPANDMSGLPPSVQEAIRQQEERERINKIIRQSEEDRKRMRDLLRPVATPQFRLPPDFKPPKIEPLIKPSPSPSPSA